MNGTGEMMKNVMKICLRAVLVGLLACMVLSATGCDKLRARDQLNKGVQAYKNGRFEDAIEHFKNSVALDPDLGVARLYLATAYFGQYVPGVDTPENNRSAEQAIEQYQKVLESQPNQTNRITALKGIASLYFNMKKFDQAKEYQRKVLEQDPTDPEAYYSIGVIDWTKAYFPRQEARQKIGLKPEEPLKDEKVCEELRGKNAETVKEGVDMLSQAMKLRKDYDDAMAYLNLMYREKADIECGDPLQRTIDLKTADGYVEQAMEVKKRKAEEESKRTGGIVMDENK
jgi:tetratricopeptide (TPR) repeat protein